MTSSIILFVVLFFFFFFNDTATTEIYTLSLHDALPISLPAGYFLPAADSDGAALLRLHGIQVQRLAREWTDTVEVLTGPELNRATREVHGHPLVEGTGGGARSPRSIAAAGTLVCPRQAPGRP